MPKMEARLKPEFTLRYPRLEHGVWYEVAPIFPGVTVRRIDMFGRRITRLRTARDFETVQSSHFEFRMRPEPAGVAAQAQDQTHAGAR